MRKMISLLLVALLAVPAATCAQSATDLSSARGPLASAAFAAATNASPLVSNGKTVLACGIRDARLSASLEGMAELTCGQEPSKTTDSEMAAAENASRLSFEEERQVASNTLLQHQGKKKGVPTPLLTAIVVAAIVSVWVLARAARGY